MLEHPIRNFLDAVAAHGEPPAAELDALVADLTREGSLTNADELRRRIAETITAIVTARDAGRARHIAQDAGRELAAELGPYRPPRDERPVQEIVDELSLHAFDRRPGDDSDEIKKIVDQIPRSI